MSGLFYPPCYALLSGGKDSKVAVSILADADKLIGCVALETGVSTPDWKEWLIEDCKKLGWPLEFFKTPIIYEDIVKKYGFPGPARHGWFMNYLKGRCILQFKQAHPRSVLASGVRLNESDRRGINTIPVGIWEGVPIFAPIYHWTTNQVWNHFHAKGFERAPAYSTLQISGDCLCGAFARDDEWDALAFHYPDVAERFRVLGESIKEKHPKRCQWGWGHARTKEKTAEQRLVCVECGDTQQELLL